MPELLERTLGEVGVATSPLLIGAVIAVVLLALVLPLRRPFRRWLENLQIDRTVRRLGAARVQGLRVPDGMGGELTIDNVVLRPEGLLIVGVKRYPGMIYGAENISEWTQVLRGRSFKFPNPFTHLQDQIVALQGILEGAPVRAVSLFAHHASFPKDKPAGVLLLSEARARGKKLRRDDIPAELWSVWQRLVELRAGDARGS
jgi:hypothetical protein